MNRLQFEKSPYLLQHKDNPVDWYAWGQESLTRAKLEDKPILLSIGYSSCHWCHVMERESFTDEQTARYMNEHFINIKLDREERPDLDKLYMDAIVAISGSGGWPLNCFLLPDKRPFYGGTYFPPQAMHQRPSWTQILQYIVHIFKDKRAEVEEQADRLTNHVTQAGSTLFSVAKSQGDPDQSTPVGKKIYTQLKKRFDRTWGGFGGAPKFPAIMSHRFLLDYFFYTGDRDALQHVIHSLNVMSRAGIYDQLSGGFARYATDKEWNIPHFEKMLYDNAQLISLYSIAYKIQPSTLFRRVVRESFHWLVRDMKSPQGGYYSAMDADSEHEEGKYYVWSFDELSKVLNAKELKLVQDTYDISPDGNWEDPFHPGDSAKNIFWVRKEVEESVLDSIDLADIKSRLLTIRKQRVPPLTDTKRILAWNSLLSMGLLDAYDAFGDLYYLQESLAIMEFIDQNLLKSNVFLHQADSTIPPMLDDLAYYIAACLHIYRSTAQSSFLDKASIMTDDVMLHYFIPENRGFKYSISSDDLIAVVHDLYDNTMPSANGMMAYNLIQLGRLLNKPDWESIGNEMIHDLAGAIIKYPESLSHWCSLLMSQSMGWLEIKGGDRRQILSKHIPCVMLNKAENDVNEEILFCHNFSCEMPAKSFAEFRLLLDKHYHTS